MNTTALTARTFADKFDRDGIYAWLNPEMPHAERYSRARLLEDFAETDEDTYDYFLSMMPPINFTHDGFAICEDTTDGVRLAFFRIAGRYFAAHIADRDTTHGMNATRIAIAAVMR